MTKKRLYISADIEGIAGVVSGEHTNPAGFEYHQAREWMTAEVVAACKAAYKCGVDEIVVSDSHGNGQGLLLDKMPSNIQVVRSWPRPLCMMEGIDVGEYVGAMLIGYHSGASDFRGILAHTLHSGAINEVCINGYPASETVISAATAAHYGVPIILVSGDDAYIEHAQSILPEVIGVVTKWSSSFTSARTLMPSAAQLAIADGVDLALSRLPVFIATPLKDDITVEISCQRRNGAELMSYLPGIERIDSHKFRFVGRNMIEVSKVLQFMIASNVLTMKA